MALLGYIFIFYLLLNHYGDVRDFAVISRKFVTQSDKSSVIKLDPDYNYEKNGEGYDGQFAYFIALDPPGARYYLDQPVYRYTRILYPVLARVAALGRTEWVPFTLVLMNILSVTVGTWALAAWCLKHRLTPWLALVYTFCIGQVLAFSRDLNEMLAYSLVAVGVYFLDCLPHRSLNWLLAGLTFGLAGLARETTLIFPFLFALGMV
ncbi:MAG: hypothetical protein M3328_04040, partial [Chloroflexota bacterium]|nr:hypothetical protein [Chloroflexota bacterium]